MIRLAAVAAIAAGAYLTPYPLAGQANTGAFFGDSRPADASTRQLGPIEDVVPVVPRAHKKTAAPVSYAMGVEGVASWMPEQYGRDYAALPSGPSWRFRVCGAGGCWTSVSNDAGPDKAMQREGRVIDLAVVRWEQVCGVDRKYGLCPVTVTILGRAE